MCHNFRADDGSTGSHYFNQGGLWSLLQEQTQASITDNHRTITNPLGQEFEETIFYIDDEYPDQPNLSFDDESPDQTLETYTFYPSAASFPDLDVGITRPFSQRTRFLSTSEPEMTNPRCHTSLRNKFRQWGSALRDAWVSTSALDGEGDSGDDLEKEKREKGAATPH